MQLTSVNCTPPHPSTQARDRRALFTVSFPPTVHTHACTHTHTHIYTHTHSHNPTTFYEFGLRNVSQIHLLISILFVKISIQKKVLGRILQYLRLLPTAVKVCFLKKVSRSQHLETFRASRFKCLQLSSHCPPFPPSCPLITHPFCQVH